MAKSTGTEKANFPTFTKGSKMKQYNLFFDENSSQAHTGFYESKFYDYTQDDSDQVYIVEMKTAGRTDLISAKFYGTAKYDWVIENANYIKDPIRDITAGKKLVIPNKNKLYR